MRLGRPVAHQEKVQRNADQRIEAGIGEVDPAPRGIRGERARQRPEDRRGKAGDQRDTGDRPPRICRAKPRRSDEGGLVEDQHGDDPDRDAQHREGGLARNGGPQRQDQCGGQRAARHRQAGMMPVEQPPRIGRGRPAGQQRQREQAEDGRQRIARVGRHLRGQNPERIVERTVADGLRDAEDDGDRRAGAAASGIGRRKNAVQHVARIPATPCSAAQRQMPLFGLRRCIASPTRGANRRPPNRFLKSFAYGIRLDTVMGE